MIKVDIVPKSFLRESLNAHVKEIRVQRMNLNWLNTSGNVYDVD